MILFDGDGSIRWETTIDELPGCPGPVAWDIDLDGTPELILADQEHLLVLDGATGTVVMSLDGHASLTMTETPAIADVDGDGHGEIIVSSGPSADGTSDWLGVRAIGSADGDWPWAPPVYNQHGYSRPTINDDLSIPSTATTAHWRSSDNIFRGQATPLDAPDLPNLQASIHDVCLASRAPSGAAKVTLQIWNSGSAEVGPGLAVRVYSSAGNGDELIYEHNTIEPIPAATSLEWTIETLHHRLGTQLHLIVDEDASVDECIEDDNRDTWTVELCEHD